MPQKKLYVLYDNDPNSKLLHAELTRDWRRGSSGDTVSAMLPIWENRRETIMKRVVLLNKREEREFRLSGIKTPAYRFGEYEAFQEFDPRTFCTSTFPLRTVESLVANYHADMAWWRRKCKELTEEADHQFFERVHCWASENYLVEWMKFNYEHFSIEKQFQNPNHKELLDRFGKLPGCPEWKEPELPECPEIPFPWEGENNAGPTLLRGEH